MLVTVLAKVKLWSELSMEMPGGAPDDKGKWKKKTMSMYAEDISRLIKYDELKTIIVDAWGERIMVFEPHDKVLEKWKKGLDESKKNNDILDYIDSEETQEDDSQNDEED